MEYEPQRNPGANRNPLGCRSRVAFFDEIEKSLNYRGAAAFTARTPAVDTLRGLGLHCARLITVSVQ